MIKKITAVFLALIISLLSINLIFAEGNKADVVWIYYNNGLETRINTTYEIGTDISSLTPPEISAEPGDELFGYKLDWSLDSYDVLTEDGIELYGNISDPVDVEVTYSKGSAENPITKEKVTGSFDGTKGDYVVNSSFESTVPLPLDYTAPLGFKLVGWSYKMADGDINTVESAEELPEFYAEEYSYEIKSSDLYAVNLEPVLEYDNNGSLTFYANGGAWSDGKDKVAVENQRWFSEIICPEENPQNNTAEFLGWNTDPNADTALDPLPLYNGETSYYAVYYKNNITVTFEVNGVIIKTEEVTLGASGIQNLIPNMEAVLNKLSVSDREKYSKGYTLVWDKTDTSMTNVTVKGSFEPNVHTVTYVVNGKEYLTEKYSYSQTIDCGMIDPSDDETEFSGWFTDKEITQSADGIKMLDEDITLYGVHYAHLIYMIDGAVYSDTLMPVGMSVPNKKVPDKEGFIFSGWSETDLVMPAANVTITGKYIIQSYTITFLLGRPDAIWKNGDSGEISRTLNYDSYIDVPEAPYCTGFIFDGWSEEIPERMPAENKTITAKWIVNPDVERKEISLIYIHADGTETIINGYAGDEVVEPSFKDSDFKEGYTVSWSVNYKFFPEDTPSEKNEIVYTLIETEPDTFKDVYYAVSSYNNVKFEYSALSQGTFAGKEGFTYQVPEIPEMEGFNSIGWTDAEGNAVKPSGVITDSDREFYASYELKSFSVTYILNGEEYAGYSVLFGSEIPKPENPSSYDENGGRYEFAGWNETIPATMPAKALTFTGEMVFVPYETETYCVTFNDSDGTRLAFYSGLEEGYKVPVTSEPEKFGKVFVGWSPEIPEKMPADDIVFTAVYKTDESFVMLALGGAVISAAAISGIATANAALVTGACVAGGAAVIIGSAIVVKHIENGDISIHGNDAKADENNSENVNKIIPETGSNSTEIFIYSLLISLMLFAIVIINKKRLAY